MHRTRTAFFLVVAAIVPPLVAVACSGEESTTPGAPTGTGGGSTGGSGGQTTGTGGSLFGDAGDAGCTPGQSCGDGGGICADDGSCCDAALLCAGGCCPTAEVCSFQQCVAPGATCVDATDCQAGHYCEYSLGDPPGQGGAGGGCQGGLVLPTGRCLPKPPECAPGQVPGDPPSCIAPCEYHPPVGQFSPELKFGWGDPLATNQHVMMAPVVIQLDDDNCDTIVDERDIPEIVFFTFTNGDYNNGTGTSATLHAISRVGGATVEKWATPSPVASPDHPGRSIAAGNIDGQPGNEIVVCTTDSRIRAYRANGTELWLSPPLGVACFMPSIADIDGDGTVEVVEKNAILDGVTGTPEVPTFTPANALNVVVSDVDGDTVLDVVTPSRAYDAAGTLIADTGLAGTHAAVGDLDRDGVPEVASVHFDTHTFSLWHVDPLAPGGFVVVRQGIDINGTINPNPCCVANPASAGCTRGGGAPTIADFDGDGFPDVGLAGGIGYVVLDGQKLMDPAFTNVETIMWITQTQDCSSAQTGSSVFDFDGDGKAEVVYADELRLHIYDGTTGTELFQTCNTNGTLFEYPLVADVDNDGHADLVVASNSYSSFNCAGTKTTGVRVYGDTLGKWVRTRAIWNQHPYHVTNVEDDGTIPQHELQNWATPGLDNFRQNVQPEGEFSAPDLIVDVLPKCAGPYGLYARVRNIGQASVPPGVVVSFYQGNPPGGTFLGTATTVTTLYALGSEDVLLSLPAMLSTPVYAVVDENNPPNPWHECRDDNNVSDVVSGECGGIN